MKKKTGEAIEVTERAKKKAARAAERGQRLMEIKEEKKMRRVEMTMPPGLRGEEVKVEKVTEVKVEKTEDVGGGVVVTVTAEEMVEEVQEKSRAIYLEHHPGKVKEVDVLLKKYAGSEAVLYQKVAEKYGTKVEEVGEKARERKRVWESGR